MRDASISGAHLRGHESNSVACSNIDHLLFGQCRQVHGGDVPALVEAIKAQERQRQMLEQRLLVLNQPAVRFDKTIERQLRDPVEEWRTALGPEVPHARQIVTKLLADKLTFTPECRENQKGFRFRATGTIAKLIDGLVSGRLSTLGPS